ncbi:MAG: hypothetical protein RIR18_724 [Pseudomonadota bacterium]
MADQAHSLAGLDLLASAVLLLDTNLVVCYANPAAENLLASANRTMVGSPVQTVFEYARTLRTAFDNAIRNSWGYTGQNIQLRRRDGEVLNVNCTVTPVQGTDEQTTNLLIELQPIDQQLKASREERLIEQQQANRELIRNLAHEIKNPLGGLRGAAQLLERELNNPALCEYTQVIIKEADRLQDLMQRLLTPHRPMEPKSVNIHEILERVRSLLTAEFPDTLWIKRDYDTSLPELMADREQLIQTILNIARNAAQAMTGHGAITLKTRAVRQATLIKRRYKLALEVQVIDNGPGIPEHIYERMFYPLVSGREGGFGLGLTLAQSFIQQHMGTIECISKPGETCFTLRFPLTA